MLATSAIQSCAVVGGGFAGLAACHFVLHRNPNCRITLFDLETGPGRSGASAASVNTNSSLDTYFQ